MQKEITKELISSYHNELENHPIYEAVSTIEELRCFMEHHIYSVWDFMSLIKYLQSTITPAQYPWTPKGDGSVRRFINELVLEEESDETNNAGEYSSHFELYHKAMLEVGADIQGSNLFLDEVISNGIDKALNLSCVPEPSKKFTSTTFEFIKNNKPHQVAAVLALGREHIIPTMFRSILDKIGVSSKEAPIFHFYLNRHISLDGDFHAPLSLKLLNSLCDGDSKKIEESIDASKRAIQARIELWDGVLLEIKKSKNR